MNLEPINKHLSERRVGLLAKSVSELEAAIKAGIVPNALYVSSKEIINRAVDEGSKAFLKVGPHKEKHSQSDWWLLAYECDAFVHGTSNINAALRRATKHGGLKEYISLLDSMVPLVELLAAAKPLIVKRQNLPKVPTAREIERTAATMTCQCCGLRYLANTGKMAHHGYQRPGHGWQTESCYGARHLPFEVDRERLGSMITSMKNYLKAQREALRKAHNEEFALGLEYPDYSVKADWKGDRPIIRIKVTRKTFDKIKKEHADGFRRSIRHLDFDSVKASDIASRERSIKALTNDIRNCKQRFDGWKPTHKGFNSKTEKWEKI